MADHALADPGKYTLLRRTVSESKPATRTIPAFFDLFAGQDNAIISRQIKKLIDKKMLAPEKEGARKYLIRFNNNYLLRGIITSLGEKGFLPIKD